MSAFIIKLAGGLLITASGFLFSKNLTGKLKADIKFADGLISGFVSLEEYICGMLMPADEALFLAANDAGDASEVFLSAVSENGNLKERFSKAMADYNKIYSDAVLPMVKGISASDDKERRTAFSIIRNRLTDLRGNAQAEFVRLERLYSGIGILLGLMIVILLF